MVICSFATGESHISMLKILKPTVKVYGKIYKIDPFLFASPQGLSSRPTSWDKIIIMNHLLQHYKTVMWIDCDAILCNPAHNIRDDLDPSYAVQLVTDFGISPLFPNGGIWVAHRNKRTFELFDLIWNYNEMIDHPWWEQAALLKLLGYEPHYEGIRYHGPTKYTDWVGPLDYKWNSRPYNGDSSPDPAILHFCRLSNDLRIKEMKKQQELFFNRVKALGNDDK